MKRAVAATYLEAVSKGIKRKCLDEYLEVSYTRKYITADIYTVHIYTSLYVLCVCKWRRRTSYITISMYLEK